jgi:hypothetical protein
MDQIESQPKYPIYVISKGRWDSRLTLKALESMGTSYHVVVEPQEYDMYAAVVDPSKIYVLPFSNLGLGSIPARNWVWEHSLSIGAKKHWIIDDNISKFTRIHLNKKTRMANGVCFRATEDFTDRYSNVALSGLQYSMFVPANAKKPPFVINTRIYSCILIRNDIPYRWRGRYNEDTDLSIRALKDGWCTILMNAFTCEKMATMRMKGGNTDELYKQNEKFDGRLEMAKSLQQQHPDITTIVHKWDRWQHHVDYSSFKKNKLIRRSDVKIVHGVNNYGLSLIPK